MFQAIAFCLLLTSSFSLPHPQAREDERGFFIDVLGGLLDGETTTAAPSESTTMATLYGDLVNIFNLIFGQDTSTTTTETATTTPTTTTSTTTTTTTTAAATTSTNAAPTTTTKCGGLIGFGLACP